MTEYHVCNDDGLTLTVLCGEPPIAGAILTLPVVQGGMVCGAAFAGRYVVTSIGTQRWYVNGAQRHIMCVNVRVIPDDAIATDPIDVRTP